MDAPKGFPGGTSFHTGPLPSNISTGSPLMTRRVAARAKGIGAPLSLTSATPITSRVTSPAENMAFVVAPGTDADTPAHTRGSCAFTAAAGAGAGAAFAGHEPRPIALWGCQSATHTRTARHRWSRRTQ